jgi:hypothetical protein
MFKGNTYKKQETSQRLICHYDLFSQTVILNKAMNKQTSFCFNAASGSLHEDLPMFCCCRLYEFTIKPLLFKAQYFHVV